MSEQFVPQEPGKAQGPKAFLVVDSAVYDDKVLEYMKRRMSRPGASFMVVPGERALNEAARREYLTAGADADWKLVADRMYRALLGGPKKEERRI